MENGCRERIRAIFREKQSRIFDFHHASCARYVVLQPIRPLLVEEDIFQAPYDQRWNLKGLKRGMNADSLRIIEANIFGRLRPSVARTIEAANKAE